MRGLCLRRPQLSRRIDRNRSRLWVIRIDVSVSPAQGPIMTTEGSPARIFGAITLSEQHGQGRIVNLAFLICIGLWLVPGIVLWVLSRRLRSSSGDQTARWASVRTLAIGWFIAPSVVSGGFAAIPAPASVALFTSVFAQHAVLWNVLLISLGSLLVCSLLAFTVIYVRQRP